MGLHGGESIPARGLRERISRAIAPFEERAESRWEWPGRRALEFSTFILILLGLCALALIPQAPRAVALGTALLLIPGAIVSRQPQSKAYSRAWNVATLLFMALAMGFTRWTLDSALQTLANLCCFLYIQKAFNFRTPRSCFHTWIITIIVFLPAPLAMSTPSIVYGLLLISLFWVSLWHLGALAWSADSRPNPRRPPRGLAGKLAAFDMKPSEAAAGQEADGLDRSVQLRPGGLPLPFVAPYLRVGLAGIALTALAFFLMPRPLFPPGGWDSESEQQARDRKSLLTGFTDQIDLDQLSSLRPNPAVALRLSGSPMLRRESIRLRATTLDYFDGFRWHGSRMSSTAIRLKRHTTSPEYRLSEAAFAAEGGAPRGKIERILVRAVDFPFPIVPTLPGVVGVEGIAGDLILRPDYSLETGGREEPKAYALYVRRDENYASGASAEPRDPSQSRTSAEPHDPGQSSASAEPRDLSQSSASAEPHDPNALAAPGQQSGPTADHLRLPRLLEGTWLSDLAARVTESADTDLQKARRIEIFLKREGQYDTDLSQYASLSGSQTVKEFLVSRHPRGHCELFATGMVLLARQAGLPSRIVTGFLGGDFEEASQSLLVRYCHAHAWVEVWIAGRGWMTFDPTPSAPLVNISDRIPFSHLRTWSEKVLTGWRRLVTEDENSARRQALAWVGDRLEQVFGPLGSHGTHGFWGQIAQGLHDPFTRKLAVILLAANALAIWGWSRARRRFALWRGGKGARDRRAMADRGTLDALWRVLASAVGGRAILDAPRGATLAEFLETEARRRGLPASAYAKALEMYQIRRFGGKEWSQNEERDFQREIERIRAVTNVG